MTKEKIEKLRRIAIDVAEGHQLGSVCGFSPDFEIFTGRQIPQVHLTYKEFCKTFDKCEAEDFDNGKMEKLFVMVDGVRFYALVEKEVE
jgi:hypothetical protein